MKHTEVCQNIILRSKLALCINSTAATKSQAFFIFLGLFIWFPTAFKWKRNSFSRINDSDTVYQMFVVSSGALQQIKQGSTEEMQNIIFTPSV